MRIPFGLTCIAFLAGTWLVAPLVGFVIGLGVFIVACAVNFVRLSVSD